LLPNKHENTALAAIFQFRFRLRVSDGPIDSPFSTFRLAGLTAITFSSSPDLPDEPEILQVVIPKKTLSFEEVAELIYKKHLNRFRSGNCRLQKKQIWLKDDDFLA
jgi:hypothetical protein